MPAAIVLLIISALAAIIYNPDPPIINGQNILGVETVCNPKGGVDETTWEYAGAFPVCLGSSQFLLYKCGGVSRYKREPCDKAPSSQPVPDSAPKPALTAATAAPNCQKDLTCNPKTTKTEIIKSTWCNTDPGVCTKAKKGAGYTIKSTYKCGAKKTRIISERCTPAPPPPSPQPGLIPDGGENKFKNYFVALKIDLANNRNIEAETGTFESDEPLEYYSKQPATEGSDFAYRIKLVSRNNELLFDGYKIVTQADIKDNQAVLQATMPYIKDAIVKIYTYRNNKKMQIYVGGIL